MIHILKDLKQMGRVTEFMHYLNEKSEPTYVQKMTEYTHMSFTEKINMIGKAYRQLRRKNEKANQ